jgi:predicted O-methyltransferase YrrM
MFEKNASARRFHDKDMIKFCQFLRSNASKDAILYEIGSFIGTSGLMFNDSFKNVHCVDAWVSGYDSNDSASFQDMSLVEKEFDKNILNTTITKHKGLSVEIAKSVKDESIDILYIDATHTYDGVKSDLEAWIPKVKNGGIISGHDYETKNEGWDNGGLKRAVHEMVGKPEYLFGTNWVVFKK